MKSHYQQSYRNRACCHSEGPEVPRGSPVPCCSPPQDVAPGDAAATASPNALEVTGFQQVWKHNITLLGMFINLNEKNYSGL